MHLDYLLQKDIILGNTVTKTKIPICNCYIKA